MAPKKQKMALGAFLADETTGTNWADEMDDMPMQPGDFEEKMGSAFGARRGGPPGAGDRPSYGGREGGYGGMDRDSRPPRPDVPFPTQPPWTAFIGNMSFECTADEVKDFFSAENITANNVRLVTEFGGKSKGFCYAEFPEAEMLRSALALSGAQLGGRTVRISVAEAPRGGDSGRSAGDWTRAGPLADLPGRSGSRTGSGDRFGSSDRYGASTPPVMDSNRDWGDARGSKFAPSQPSSPGMGSRSAFGERRDPPARMGMGFGNGSAGGPRDRDSSGPSTSSGPVDDGRDWSAMRGGRFEATPTAAPKPTFGSERRAPERSDSQVEETRDWRARTAPSSPPPEAAAAAAPAAPVERKKLQLAARSSSGPSGDVQSPDAENATPASATRSSIFGGAAPVDTAAKEAAIAEKLRKQKEEAEAKRLEEVAARKAAAEAAAADKPASSNPFGDAKPVDATAREKEVEEKLAKDKAELAERMKEASLAEKASPPAPQQREWRRGPGATNGAPKSQDTASGQQQHQRYNKPSNNVQIQRRDREPSASSPDSAAPAKPAQPPAPRQFSKDQNVRKQGFSYSMASKSQSAADTSAGAAAPSSPTVAAASENAQ